MLETYTQDEQRSAIGFDRTLKLRHSVERLIGKNPNRKETVVFEVSIPTEKGEEKGHVEIDHNMLRGLRSIELTHEQDLVRSGHGDTVADIIRIREELESIEPKTLQEHMAGVGDY